MKTCFHEGINPLMKGGKKLVAKSNKIYKNYLISLKNRKYLSHVDFDKYATQLTEFHSEFYINKNPTLGKQAWRYVIEFLKYGVSDDWISRIKRIIELGHSNCKEKALLKFGDIEGENRWREYTTKQAKKEHI